MKNLSLILIFSLSIGIPTFLSAQDYYGKDKDIQQILENIKIFSQHYMNGNVQGIVDSYTEDGKIFPGNLMITEGRPDLTKYWTTPEGIKVLHHKIIPSEIRIVKKYAYDFGYYEGKTQNAKGEEFPFYGKYVIVWRKVGKDWKIYLDIWNRVRK